MKSNNEQPLISIIVPVYKVEKYLDRCVESIVNQTYKNLEIILVDDGSPDNCPAMCDEWAKKDNRIRVIHKTNGGVSRARNDGMKVSSGEFISFIDSDDWIYECFIEKLYAAIENTECDISECDYIICDAPVGIIGDEKSKEVVYTAEETLRCNLSGAIFCDVVWNKLYRREIAISVEFMPDKRHEDVFWVYQVLSKSEKSVHIFAPFYCYFQRRESYMNESYSKERLVAIDAAEQRCEFINRNHPNLAGLAQSQFIGMCMYHSQKLLQFKIKGYNDYFKDLHIRSKKIGDDWSKGLSKKQRLWIGLYLACPKFICTIRNLLKIGI